MTSDPTALRPAAPRPARATDAEDKQRRRNEILDAVDRLQLVCSGRDMSMADVAQRAGLAKGTVYLYFESKEALLVAAYARRIDAFFDQLIAAAEGAHPFGIDELARLVRHHLTGPADYMALAGQCMALLDRPAVAGEAAALSARIAERLARAGAGLERRYPLLGRGEGARLLIHGYALIVGLWHLTGTAFMERGPIACLLPGLRYTDEADLALRRHWRQAVGEAAALALPTAPVSQRFSGHRE